MNNTPPTSAEDSASDLGDLSPQEASAAVLAPPEGPDELGRLAHYRVVNLLGQGGMGLVFEAEDLHLRRRTALKVLLPDLAAQAKARARFLREARAAAALKHDHIVTIYQVGEDRSVPFLAMEFLQGMALEQWLVQTPQPAVAQVLRIGHEAASGLAAAHACGLVHRDIKPANLWLESPKGRVKILDFGLARSTDDDARLTRSGAVMGTPAYMAPEQARGEPVDHRCDLFSLGCVLYQMATGEVPFKGKSVMAVLTALATSTPVPVRDLNPTVPPALGQLIERLMAKDPAGRPASAEAVADELAAIGYAMASGVQPAAAPVAQPRQRLWIAAGAVAALLGLGAAFVMTHRDPSVSGVTPSGQSKGTGGTNQSPPPAPPPGG